MIWSTEIVMFINTTEINGELIYFQHLQGLITPTKWVKKSASIYLFGPGKWWEWELTEAVTQFSLQNRWHGNTTVTLFFTAAASAYGAILI